MFENLLSITDEVRRAVDAKLYYAALAVSLTLPDICVALTFDNFTEVRGKHYKAFIDAYATTSGLNTLSVTSDDCYRLRCGVIHRGNAAGNSDFGATHVIFTIPESQRSMHGFTLDMSAAGGGSSAMIDLISFCQAMEASVYTWMDAHKNHPNVIRNLPNLLSWRPLGMPPFINGFPVIACGT